MSATDRFDQRLTGLLDDLAAPHYPDYFDDVLDRAMRNPQRPAWTFPERWLPMSVLARRTAFAPTLPLRTVGILIILGLLLAMALAIGFGSRRVAPPFGLAENGLMAYTSDGDIYVRNGVADPPRILVGGPSDDVSPIFSRDGTKFAFIRVSRNEGGAEVAELLVASADGSNLHSLVGPERDLYWWEWSPSGKEIAIVSKVSGLDSLSVVNVEGEPVRTTIDMDVTPHGVWWRPTEGAELVFQGQNVDRFAIYGVRSDGTGLRRITPEGPDSDYMWPFSLSPDGNQLAYTRGDDLTVQARLLDLDTGADRRFFSALPPPAPEPSAGWYHDGYPVFSPDGKRVVFGRYWDERDTQVNHQLWVASAGGHGEDAVPVGPVARTEGGRNPFAVTFSPDGTKILISRTDIRQIFVADQAGGEAEELPWNTGELPDWQRLAPTR